MKADTRAPQGFQLNIEVPKEPMEVLHINFTKVNSKFVMIVVDRFGFFGFRFRFGYFQQNSDLVGIAQGHHQ